MDLDGGPDDVGDPVDAPDVVLRQPRDAVGRHAVDAPEVAPIGDADSQDLHRADRAWPGVELRGGGNEYGKPHAGNIVADDSNPQRRAQSSNCSFDPPRS